MNAKIKGIPVKDVEADEIWGFVKMKRINTKGQKGITDPFVGDQLHVCRNRTQHKTRARVAS